MSYMQRCEWMFCILRIHSDDFNGSEHATLKKFHFKTINVASSFFAFFQFFGTFNFFFCAIILRLIKKQLISITGVPHTIKVIVLVLILLPAAYLHFYTTM